MASVGLQVAEKVEEMAAVAMVVKTATALMAMATQVAQAAGSVNATRSAYMQMSGVGKYQK